MKRAFDFLMAFVLLLIFSPIFLVLMVLVRAKIGSPVFFRQERPGIHGKIFTLVKFRTMTSAQAPDGGLLPDAQRITRLGRILRRTSLDEIPELWNILIGEMSFVGPRPLLPKYLPFYTETEMLRHTVRPGLTGLAQVSGRNSISWEQKLDLDVFYVKNRSMLLDLRILFLTVYKVFKRENILDQAPQGALDVYRQKLGKKDV